ERTPPPESGFRDQVFVEYPTPTGQRIGESSGPAPRPSRVPLLVSAMGFLVALGTLAYVAVIRPNINHKDETARAAASPAPKPSRDPETGSLEPKKGSTATAGASLEHIQGEDDSDHVEADDPDSP